MFWNVVARIALLTMVAGVLFSTSSIRRDSSAPKPSSSPDRTASTLPGDLRSGTRAQFDHTADRF
jgi:hypothetical protein